MIQVMRTILLFFFVIIQLKAFSQVGIGTSSPNSKAVLDISSTTKGMLPPRMSIGERDAIANPPEGLLIFNTTTKTIQCFDGTSWTSLTSAQKHYVGENYGGGVVFYTYDNGQHGLIAASADQGRPAWSLNLSPITTSSAYGTGNANTTAIVASQGAGSYAAKICADYSVTVSGVTYDDWYLPSKDELTLLYNQNGTLGGFATGYYWSSTEATSNNTDWAWAFYFPSGGGWCLCTKTSGNIGVRPIRAF